MENQYFSKFSYLYKDIADFLKSSPLKLLCEMNRNLVERINAIDNLPQ
jgi:hypothetical protein